MKNNSMAKASMILGIAGIVLSCTCCFGCVASALALTFGLLSRTEEQMYPNAKTGIITGSIGLALSFLFACIWLFFLGSLDT